MVVVYVMLSLCIVSDANENQPLLWMVYADQFLLGVESDLHYVIWIVYADPFQMCVRCVIINLIVIIYVI